MKNSNQNTDAWALGFRFRLELSGQAANRLTPEFCKTRAETKLRCKELRASGIVATVFELTEDGGLRQ